MGGNAVVAAGELYIGLVEVGVGLIPAAAATCSCCATSSGALRGIRTSRRVPFLQKVFMQIGLAKVATSAEEASEAGFLIRGPRHVSLNRDHLLHTAKQRVLGLAQSGWRPPRPDEVPAARPRRLATIDMMLYSMVQNGQISEHDRLIGQKLATCPDRRRHRPPALTEEQHLLDSSARPSCRCAARRRPRSA